MNYDFNNEEEIKQYLKNVGTEYRFGCLSEKKPEVCHVYGEYLELISEDVEKSAKILKMNCDDYSYPRSCETYGKFILTNKVKEIPKEKIAFEYMFKACHLDQPRSCYNAGILALDKSINADAKKGYKECISLMEKGCDLNNGHSCFFLSKLFIKGTSDNIINRDLKNGFKYSLKSCELGNPKACFNLSTMYKKGEGVEKNEELSKKYKIRAEKIRKFYYQ